MVPVAVTERAICTIEPVRNAWRLGVDRGPHSDRRRPLGTYDVRVLVRAGPTHDDPGRSSAPRPLAVAESDLGLDRPPEPSLRYRGGPLPWRAAGPGAIGRRPCPPALRFAA